MPLRTSRIDMEEIWRDVEGYEGRYQVSSHGNIRKANGTLRKLQMTDTYVLIGLGKNGTRITKAVHCLVAQSFLESPCCPMCGGKFEVNHKNGNKHDNRVSNLEYVTRKQNSLHCRRKRAIGRSSTLTEERVKQIKKKILAKERNCDIAAEFHISPSMVCDIKKGRNWAHLSS